MNQEDRTVIDPAPVLRIERYGRRNWAVFDRSGELIVVAVYLKGATEVAGRISALEAQIDQLLGQPMQLV